MSSSSCRVFLGLVLLSWMCVEAFYKSVYVTAQLNCTTAQCVEIPFNNVGTVANPKNGNCLMSWITRPGFTGYISYAYSASVVITTGYGQNSKGGSAQGGATGFYIACSGSADCGNNVTPVSGSASNWDTKAINSNWKSQCSGKGG